ncbi:MAG TPA: hypothetical protein VFB35_01595 [Gaiellaceae bacterium]|nr:hypothetical protein [Gaiellaceae bacterium]
MAVSAYRLAAGGLVAGIVLTLLFAFSYVGALHDPHPTGMAIGVVDARSAAAVEASGGLFRPRAYPDEARVRAALRRREVLAALVPPRLLVDTAGGYAATQYVQFAFTRAQPRLQVEDVAPLPAGDSRGLTLFYLSIALIFGGYFGATVITTLVGPRSPGHRGAALRVSGLVAFALITGFLCAVLVGPILDTVPGHVLEIGAIGTLVVLAAAMATSALQSVLGIAGTLVAMVAFVIFGNSSAGGAYPGSFVPGFWRDVGPWLPTGAGLSALRGEVYFGGAAIGGRLLLLGVYALAGALLTIGLGWRRGLRIADDDAATAAAEVATAAAV